MNFFLVVHLQIDEHNVLQELGGQQVIALFCQYSHSLYGRFSFNDTSVAVLAVVHHALFVLVNNL